MAPILYPRHLHYISLRFRKVLWSTSHDNTASQTRWTLRSWSTLCASRSMLRPLVPLKHKTNLFRRTSSALLLSSEISSVHVSRLADMSRRRGRAEVLVHTKTKAKSRQPIETAPVLKSLSSTTLNICPNWQPQRVAKRTMKEMRKLLLA